jgi:hypothetical protein
LENGTFIVDLPIKDGDFPEQTVGLREDNGENGEARGFTAKARVPVHCTAMDFRHGIALLPPSGSRECMMCNATRVDIQFDG